MHSETTVVFIFQVQIFKPQSKERQAPSKVKPVVRVDKGAGGTQR